MHDTAQHDYLAVISTSGGIGSWARGSDKAKVIEQVTRRYAKDWLGNPGPAFTVTVNVIDVTGFDTVSWDSQGFWSDSGKIERQIEHVEHIYPAAKKRRH